MSGDIGPHSWPHGSLLAVLSFLSGMAGLAFEMVWFHRTGLVFGNSIWSTSIVLSSFMGGLALGNALAGRFAHAMVRYLRIYALLEISIALAGLALTYLLPELTSLLVPVSRHLGGWPWLANSISLATAFAVIALPAAAMGATLPVLVGALCQSSGQSLGTVLGRLYGCNTLGAVVGVLGAELVLIPRFGIAGTAWAAAGVNLMVAGGAWWTYRSTDAVTIGLRWRHPGTPGRQARRLLMCAFLSGCALMALEVVWLRFLSMFVVNTTMAVGLMLAVVLAAIGVGGLVASTWLDRHSDAQAYMPLVAVGSACTVTISYLAFRFATHGSLVAEWYRILWFSAVLTCGTAFLSGVLFTLIGAALKSDSINETRTAGWLTLANTFGAMCGPLIATFVLLPVVGLERAFFASAATYCVIAFLTLPAEALSARGLSNRTFSVAAVAGALALGAFPFGLMSETYFPRAAEPYTGDGSRIIATREGTSETIFLAEQTWRGQSIYKRLVTNGFSMSGTQLTSSRYMKDFVYWPMLLHQEPLQRALVVCYGVGVTVKAVTDVKSIKSIDVVELSPDVVAMSDLIYAPDEHPLHDPRVRLYLEDGRQFLQRTETRYDLITGEPPPPLTPGAVNLYTREYFQLLYDRLAEGGMATYWVPVSQRGDYAVGPIIKAFCQVFRDCSLWNGTLFDWMLVGTRNARGPVSMDAFEGYWRDPVIGLHLREIGHEMPEQIGAAFLGDAPYLNELTRQSAALTDDYPRRLVARSASPAFPISDHEAADEVELSFGAILDPHRTRKAFETSAFVRHLWPRKLAEATIPFFDQQGIINRVMLEGANPLRHIGAFHDVLTQTELRRLPLWMLGSNDVLQRAAGGVNDGSGTIEFLLGQRLLVARDYLAAADFFEKAEQRGFQSSLAGALEVFALCMSGQIDRARQRAPVAMPLDADECVFWRWIATHFGVGPDA